MLPHAIILALCSCVLIYHHILYASMTKYNVTLDSTGPLITETGLWQGNDSALIASETQQYAPLLCPHALSVLIGFGSQLLRWYNLTDGFLRCIRVHTLQRHGSVSIR